MALLFAIRINLVNAGVLDAQTFNTSNFEFFFRIGLYINVLLFVFNLLPFPQLDGFTILVGIVPEQLAAPLIASGNQAMLRTILLAVIFVLPMMGYDALGFIFNAIDPIISLLIGQ